MMRILITAASLALAARTASAQGILSDAKTKAQRVAAATNAHIDAEQKPEGQAQPKPATKVAATAPVSPAVHELPANKLTRPTVKPAANADSSGPPPTIMREMYAFGADGRRDPFVSLLTTNELRPTMSDLRLTGILYDQSGRHSVATMRDLTTNAQYRVGAGSKLGRMTVAAIRLKVVVFTIDEFGTTRQDSLVLGDSTKVRGK